MKIVDDIHLAPMQPPSTAKNTINGIRMTIATVNISLAYNYGESFKFSIVTL